MNPDPWGEGLRLNISDSDNAQELDLAMEVAPYFRVKVARALEITEQVIGVVRDWRQEATRLGLSPSAQDRMARAFRMAEEGSS